jgi:non-canonical (house-cleaning) NTP pyrophosphatase
MNTNTYKVVLASQAEPKLQAVSKAFQHLNLTLGHLSGVSASSDINDQPCGDEETARGAHNRLNHAQTLEPGADLYIAIENGVRSDGHDRWFDFGVIMISDGTKMVTTHSMGLEIPVSVVATVKERGFSTTTIGKILHEQGLINHHQDPHKELTNTLFPRERILTLAVEVGLAQILPHTIK